jgi:hypothetical protein
MFAFNNIIAKCMKQKVIKLERMDKFTIIFRDSIIPSFETERTSWQKSVSK